VTTHRTSGIAHRASAAEPTPRGPDPSGSARGRPVVLHDRLQVTVLRELLPDGPREIEVALLEISDAVP
jgi:hypothetical protein